MCNILQSPDVSGKASSVVVIKLHYAYTRIKTEHFSETDERYIGIVSFKLTQFALIIIYCVTISDCGQV